MSTILATWDEKFATTEEAAIAKRINEEVGYEGTSFQGDELSFPVEN